MSTISATLAIMHPQCAMRNGVGRVAVQIVEGNIDRAFDCKHGSSTTESKTWGKYGNLKCENKEIPSASWRQRQAWSTNPTEGNADMYAAGTSDDFVVPPTGSNKAAVAEIVEERKSPQGSAAELSSMFQTPSWMQHQMERHSVYDR